MDDLQNLIWEHFEHFIYYAVWAWRFVVAESFGASNENTVIKDLRVEPLSLLESLEFILSNL